MKGKGHTRSMTRQRRANTSKVQPVSQLQVLGLPTHHLYLDGKKGSENRTTENPTWLSRCSVAVLVVFYQEIVNILGAIKGQAKNKEHIGRHPLARHDASDDETMGPYQLTKLKKDNLVPCVAAIRAKIRNMRAGAL